MCGRHESCYLYFEVSIGITHKVKKKGLYTHQIKRDRHVHKQPSNDRMRARGSVQLRVGVERHVCLLLAVVPGPPGACRPRGVFFYQRRRRLDTKRRRHTHVTRSNDYGRNVIHERVGRKGGGRTYTMARPGGR